MAETAEFFARARIDYTPTFIKEFTAENLAAAIQEGIDKKAELEGAKVVSFTEQQKLNTVKELDFDALMKEFNDLVGSIPGSSDINGATPEGANFIKTWRPAITAILEKHLGKERKMSQCNANQVEAVSLIVGELKELIEKNKNN